MSPRRLPTSAPPQEPRPASDHTIAPGLDPAGDGSASDTVFYGIVNGLELQRFVPGQRLVETDLAAHFGVGRNSVREALQRLAAEGIVELPRHRSAAIRALSPQDTLDVLDVAERITGLLARSAARGSADADCAAALRQAIDDLADADAAHDSAAFASARRRFYRTLLEMSGNRELRRLFPAIQMPIVYAQHRLGSLQALRLRDYRVIAEAVLAGRAEAADAAGTAHVRNVREAIGVETAREAATSPATRAAKR